MNYEELYQNAVNLFKEKKLEQSVSIINKLLKNIENNSLYQELYVKATNLHAAYNESKGNLKGSISDLKVVNKLEPYNVNYLNNISVKKYTKIQNNIRKFINSNAYQQYTVENDAFFIFKEIRKLI